MDHAAAAERHFFAGTRLLGEGDIAGAEAAFRDAIVANPRMIAAWCNLGVALATQKREDEAEACYRTALRLAPDYRNAAFNLAYVLLRQGRYEEGWACFEARDWYERLERLIPCPRWQGAPLAGKAVLIGVEAGHGDMIQFCRYATRIKAAGAVRVDVLCHPKLKRLFGRLNGADRAIGLDEPLPHEGWDYWVPPLSLPFLFSTRVDSVPAELPYLSADLAQAARWRDFLDDKAADLRVGIVWKGSAGFENDADRSLPSLDVLAPLSEVPGVRFVSLQKERADATPPPFPIADVMAQVDDFADTAAVIVNLDLVIGVDTAVAHLAGALAKPCWVLLPYYQTDWRWLADRDDSPWYPRVMRLFRQHARRDWSREVAELATALRLHSAAWHSSPPSSRRA